jgi:hypothetical protein
MRGFCILRAQFRAGLNLDSHGLPFVFCVGAFCMSLCLGGLWPMSLNFESDSSERLACRRQARVLCFIPAW